MTHSTTSTTYGLTRTARRALWALAALSAIVAPGLTRTARAQDERPAAVDQGSAPPTRRSPFEGTKIAIGGRLGYGLGLLDLVQGSALDTAIEGVVPVVFDAGPRFRNGTEVGLYAQLAFGIPAAGAGACDDCSVFGFRLGAQINQHFNSGGVVDPWIGAGLGLDWLTVSQSSTVAGVTNSGNVRDVRITSSTTYRALPEGVLQAGLDFGGDQLAIGPFVSLSLASYASAEREVECHDFACPRGPLASSSSDIADERRALHAWLLFGIHGNYLL